MQYNPRAAPPGPLLPSPASPRMRAVRRPARGPLDIAAARAGPTLGAELLLNKAPASPPVVTHIASRPHSAPRFVVQLCQSTQPIDPRHVPKLDVFDLYHLYCHSESRDGELRHSLRLGYFKEPAHAEAIASYLAPHFRHALIAQIDAAEIISSLRRKFLPRKDIGASGQHVVVVLATPPPVRAVRQIEAPIQAPNHSFVVQSRWSWLLNPLRRLHAAAQQLA